MKYEWDEGKRRNNLRKHGLDFKDAHEVFLGPRLVRLDTRDEYGEARWVAVGFLKNRVVVIVYTEDDTKEVVRVISLRKALDYERKRFEEYLSY
jgi:uncharacterized DUF497 family protein